MRQRSTKSAPLQYGRIRDDEIDALGALWGESFGFPDDTTQLWLNAAGVENIRVVRRRGVPVAGLIVVPMGQRFGGRALPMMGISGVAVAAEVRGQGIASLMMRKAVHEMRRAGFALSSLYPASVPLYRRAGYEIAGVCWRMSVRGKTLRAQERPLEVRRYQESDEKQVRAVYAAYARDRNGWLDRGPYVWPRSRRRDPISGIKARGHVFCDGARIDGYVFYRQKHVDGGFNLMISDLAARTPAAMQMVMSFIADQRSLAQEVVWYGGADDPWLMLMPEHRYRIELHHHWMLRIIDVAAALEGRGYPKQLRADLHFDVRDDVTRAGRYRLRVKDGRGQVSQSGRGTLRLDVRALAALYSGHLTAAALAQLGRIDGPAGSIDKAGELFAGPAPSMADFF